MKKKQFYEKPSIEVVELKQKCQILAGSSGDGNINPMSDPEDL